MRDVDQTEIADWDEERPWPIALSDAQRLDWLRLIRTPHVGPSGFKSLINRYGGAEAALDALPGLPGRRRLTPCPREVAERERDAVVRLGARFLAPGEAGYPTLLRHSPSPPPLLTVWGEGAVDRPAVAIVGPRNASAMGLKFTTSLAHDLSEAGLLVVSGLARGVDAAAHEASLGNGTAACLAGGLDRIYPPEHEGLAAAIRERGALVSEMPLGHGPRAKDFPRRNRLVAGMALGTVVVQAALRSGSLITARLANEMGRDVFAVPGFPLDPRAEGTNRLIRDGATLITGADDVLDVLDPGGAYETAPASPFVSTSVGTLADAETQASFEPAGDGSGGVTPDAVLALLGPEPTDIDDLVRATKASASIVRSALFELELSGRLERHGAQRVSRRG